MLKASLLSTLLNCLYILSLGFWEAYSSVREDVMKSIVKAMNSHYKQHNELVQRINQHHHSIENQNVNLNYAYPKLSQNQLKSISHELSKPLRLYFAGHSLGAALAVLAALDVSVNMNFIIDAIKSVYPNVSYASLEGIDMGKTPESTCVENYYTTSRRSDGRTKIPTRVFSSNIKWEVPTMAVYTYGGERR